MFNRKNFYILALVFSFLVVGLGQSIKSLEELLAQSPPLNNSPTPQPSSSTTSTPGNLSTSIDTIVKKSYEDKKYLQAAQIQLEAEAMAKRYARADLVLRISLEIKYFAFFTGLLIIVVGVGYSLIKTKKFEEFKKLMDQEFEKSKVSDTNKTVTELFVWLLYPGYFLCLIGVIIIVVSVLYNPNISLQDERIYISNDIEPNPVISP